MDILFIHIPHTGGRLLKTFIRRNKHQTKIHYVHSAQTINKFKRVHKQSFIPYFVLRHPVNRCISEFVHYSKILNEYGMINHLFLSKIKETNKDFDHLDPYSYFSIEETRNVMCKYLLLRTDFSQPITDDEFHQLVDTRATRSDSNILDSRATSCSISDPLILDSHNYVYDSFEYPIIHSKLASLLNIDINQLSEELGQIKIQLDDNKEYKQQLLNDQALVEFISEKNQYDMAFFSNRHN